GQCTHPIRRLARTFAVALPRRAHGLPRSLGQPCKLTPLDCHPLRARRQAFRGRGLATGLRARPPCDSRDPPPERAVPNPARSKAMKTSRPHAMLVFFHCGTNNGYSITMWEDIFWNMALNVVGASERIHFAYATMENG